MPIDACGGRVRVQRSEALAQRYMLIQRQTLVLEHQHLMRPQCRGDGLEPAIIDTPQIEICHQPTQTACDLTSSCTMPDPS